MSPSENRLVQLAAKIQNERSLPGNICMDAPPSTDFDHLRRMTSDRETWRAKAPGSTTQVSTGKWVGSGVDRFWIPATKAVDGKRADKWVGNGADHFWIPTNITETTPLTTMSLTSHHASDHHVLNSHDPPLPHIHHTNTVNTTTTPTPINTTQPSIHPPSPHPNPLYGLNLHISPRSCTYPLRHSTPSLLAPRCGLSLHISPQPDIDTPPHHHHSSLWAEPVHIPSDIDTPLHHHHSSLWAEPAYIPSDIYTPTQSLNPTHTISPNPNPYSLKKKYPF